MPAGQFRRAYLFHRFVIKLPRIRNLSGGLRSNRWEREIWRKWRLKFPQCTDLCPVLVADPLGLFVVMPRASQPVTETEADEFSANDPYPGRDCEGKIEDLGYLDGRVVALDYGLPYADLVAKRRTYLRKLSETA